MAYDLQLVNGVLKLEGGNERVLIIPVTVIAKMHEEFYKIVGIASNVVMREVGKCLGESVVEVVEKELGEKEKNMTNLLDAIAKYLNKSGFGEISIENDGNKFIVNIKGAPSSLVFKGCERHVGSTACYFEEGVIMGIMEKLLDKRVRVKREKVDDETCVIEVKEA